MTDIKTNAPGDIVKVRVINAPGYADFDGDIITTELPLERMAVRYVTEGGERDFAIIPSEYVHITSPLFPPVKYRWIMYAHQPYGMQFGSFELTRHASLKDCADRMRYNESATSGDWSASLYAYSDKSWAEAEEYREIGCPFDYPAKLIERGPRGGMRVTNA